MEMTNLIALVLLESFILVIFMFFLVHKGRHKTSNYALAFFFFTQLIGITAYVPFTQLPYFRESLPHLIFLGVPFALLWSPSFYYYVLLTTGSKPWKPVYVAHAIPFLVYGFYFLFNYHMLSFAEKQLTINKIIQGPMLKYLTYVINTQVIVYNILALRQLHLFKKFSRSGKLAHYDRKNLQWLTYIVFGYLFACFIDDVIITQLRHIAVINSGVASSIVFLLLFTVLFYKGITTQEVLISPVSTEKYKASTLGEKEALAIAEKLDQYMKNEKPFHRPNLSLKELSEELAVPERHLSQVINSYKSQNFYDYLNQFRIAEAKRLLTDDTNDFNVTQILYEVGFNSKTAFNRAFKKHTGLTPSLYKRRAQHPDKGIVA